MNRVLSSTRYVVENSRHVRINHDKIKQLAVHWVENNIQIPIRQSEDILEGVDERKLLDYLIVLDAINFCFWAPFTKMGSKRKQEEKWNIKYNNSRIDGYYAFSLALKKFFKEYPEESEIINLSKMNYDRFAEIFAGKGELQFVKKRWQIIRAVGDVIMGKYGGNSIDFILSTQRQFSNLVPKIVKELPFFDDVAKYDHHKIFLLKRAQILACDIFFAFKGEGIGKFDDLGYLTAMADYKLPQLLRHKGILGYSSDLANKIKNKILIKSGSREEVEIRSATIWSVEYLRRALMKLGKEFHSFEIDWMLWVLSQTEIIKEPYHLTPTIYY